MPIGTISNGESGSSCRTKINAGFALLDAETAAGRAIATAADAAAQRTALGATAAGTAIFTGADAAAQRTSLGATSAGSALFTAANVAAQLAALGGTSAGIAVFQAADAAAQRAALGLGSMATQASGAVAITDGTISGLTQLGVSMANNTAMTGFSLGTITDTTSRPFTISQTWNNAGGTFTGLRFAATVTAANANSKLLDLLGGAAGTTSLAFVSSSGRFNCPGRFGVGEPAYAVDSSASNGMGASSGNGLEFWAAGGKTFSVLRAGTKANQAQIGSASAYAWNGTSINSTNTTADADLLLFRDAAGICAQRDGTAGQTKRIYGTYTDASNYTRLSLAATSTTAVVAAETAGTGADNIDLQLTPAGTGCVRFGSHSAIGAETVTGYITIKDAGGTERKVAIVS